MKSKKFFYNKALFKKNFIVDIMLMVALTIAGLFYGPIAYNVNVNAPYRDPAEPLLSRKLDVIAGFTDGLSSYIFIQCCAALIVAIIVFSFLYKRTSAYMHHAFPFTRKELFFNPILRGLLILTVPQIINGIIMLIMVAGLQGGRTYILSIYAMILAAEFISFALTVLLIMVTGVSYLPPVLFFIFQYLYVYLKSVIQSIIGTVTYGASTSYNLRSKDVILSPIQYFHYRFDTNIDKGAVTLIGDSLYYYYFLAAIIMIAIAYIIYRNRPMEATGDFLILPWLKIFFGIGITCCAALGIMAFAISMEADRGVAAISGGGNMFIAFVVSIIVYGIVSMIIYKTVRINKRRIIIPALGVGAFFLIAFGIIGFDVMGIERYIPKKDEIESASMSGYINGYTTTGSLRDTKNIDSVILWHYNFIDNKKEILENMSHVEGHFMEVSIRYVLKNGRFVDRHYNIPYNKESMKEDTLFREYDEEFNNLDNIVGDIFRNKKPATADISINKEHVDEYGETYYESDYIPNLSKKGLMDAIIKDLDEGNLRIAYPGVREWDYCSPYDFEVYDADIFVGYNEYIKEWENNNNTEDCGTYVYSYYSGQNKESDVQFKFNSNCKNILQFLSDSGYDITELRVIKAMQ